MSCLRSTGFRRSQGTANIFQKLVSCPWPHQDVNSDLRLNVSIFYNIYSRDFCMHSWDKVGKVACLAKSVVKSSLHLWIFWFSLSLEGNVLRKNQFILSWKGKNVRLLSFCTLHLTIQVQYRKYRAHATQEVFFYWK